MRGQWDHDLHDNNAELIRYFIKRVGYCYYLIPDEGTQRLAVPQSAEITQELLGVQHNVHQFFALLHSLANIDRIAGLLLGSQHDDKLVGSQLGVADLFVEGGAGDVGFGEEAMVVEQGCQFLGVGIVCGTHRDDGHLTGTQPERPVPSEMLSQNCKLPFQTSKNGTMQNHGTALGFIGSAIGQVETDGELKVELDGGALVLALVCVLDANVNLWTVKGTITGVEFPLETGAIHGGGELLLGLVPLSQFSQKLVGASGQDQGELVAKDTVNVLQKVQAALNLGLDLVGTTEYVRVVLLEATDTGQAIESPESSLRAEHQSQRNGSEAHGRNFRCEQTSDSAQDSSSASKQKSSPLPCLEDAGSSSSQ